MYIHANKPKELRIFALITVCLLLIITALIFRDLTNKENPDSHADTFINVQNYGANGYDKKDDTRSIRDALSDANKKGIRKVIFPKGNYIVSSIIKIKKPIVIKGNNATLELSQLYKQNKFGQGFFYAKSVNDIKISDLKFNGNKTQLSRHKINNFVVWFENSSNVLINNCHVINLNGRGTNLNSAFSFVGSSNNIRVLHNLIENSNGGAIFFQGKHSIASDNTAINLKDVAFVANGLGAKNIIFKYNIASKVSSGSIGIENGPSHIKIYNNRIYSFTDGYGIGIVKIKSKENSLSNNVSITNNLIDESEGINPCNGIAVVNGENVSVKKNMISNIRKTNPSNNSIFVSAKSNRVHIFLNSISKTLAPMIVNEGSKKTIIEKNIVD